MQNEYKISFLSKKSNISIIRNMVGIILLDVNPTLTFINEIKTIVSEGITNAIVHGYQGAENRFVDINVKTNLEMVIIDIYDNGVGIEDIEKAKEPLFTTKEDEERSGLGFTIMELFSNKLEIISSLNKGTHLHIEKKW